MDKSETTSASPPRPPSADSRPGPMDEYEQKWGLSADQEVIMISDDYAVWLDENHGLWWRTSRELDKRVDEKVGPEKMNAVFNQAAVLQAYPVDHLTDSQ